MIHLETNEPVKDHEGFFVAAPTGDYNEIDLLECYHQDNPSVAICMYQAQCIKFGDAIYKQQEPLNTFQIDAMLRGVNPEDVVNNEDLLKKEIVDTEKSGKVVGRQGTLKQADVASVVDEPMTIEDFTDSLDPKKKKTVPVDAVSPTTPPVDTTPAPDTVSTPEPTPSITVPEPLPELSTTTPPVIIDDQIPVAPLPLDVSTTTPDFTPQDVLPETVPATEVIPLDTSTTTPN